MPGHELGELAMNLDSQITGITSLISPIFGIIGFALVGIGLIKWKNASMTGESLGGVLGQIIVGAMLMSIPMVIATMQSVFVPLGHDYSQTAGNASVDVHSQSDTGYLSSKLAIQESAVAATAQAIAETKEMIESNPLASAYVSGVAEAIAQSSETTITDTTSVTTVYSNELENSLTDGSIKMDNSSISGGKPHWNTLKVGAEFSSGIYEYVVINVDNSGVTTKNQFGEQVVFTESDYNTL